MASQHLEGADSIFYTPPGGTLTEHKLAVPIMEIQAADRRKTFRWESADFTAIETVTVGAGVDEIMFTIRADNQPALLRQMLRHGYYDGVTLTVRHRGTDYPTRLVGLPGASGSDVVGLAPDRERMSRGEYEVRVHVRRVDGGTFDALLAGTAP